MREKKPYTVISFHTTQDAIAMERKCAEAGIPGRLIPIPREITAGCGLAWRIGTGEYRDCADRLAVLGLNFEAVTELLL